MSKSVTTHALHLYAHPVSQPSRAVLWLAALHDLPLQVHRTDPLSGDTATEAYRKTVHAQGLIPVLRDTSLDPPLVLSER